MKTYTIDRSKWVNGGTPADLGPSQLLNEKGRMCCLGQICRAEGMPENILQDIGQPDYLPNKKDIPAWLMDGKQSSDVAQRMMNVNDKSHIAEAEREHRLTLLAAAEGIELKFTGELFPKDKP